MREQIASILFWERRNGVGMATGPRKSGADLNCKKRVDRIAKARRWIRSAKEELLHTSLSWYFEMDPEQMQMEAEKARLEAQEAERQKREIEWRRKMRQEELARQQQAQADAEARARHDPKQLGKIAKINTGKNGLARLQLEYEKRKARLIVARMQRDEQLPVQEAWVDPYGRTGWTAVNTNPKMRTAWGSVQSKGVVPCNKPSQNNYFHKTERNKTAVFTRFKRSRSLPRLSENRPR